NFYPPSPTSKEIETNGASIKVNWDPTNDEFDNWLASKFRNHETMDQCTRNALWDYWKRGDDEEVITENKLSNPINDNLIEENEIAQIFRIDNDIFHFEIHLYEAFKEFNYLSQIDVDVITKDIPGFKTYEEYKDDWIYERNDETPWVNEKPWNDDEDEYYNTKDLHGFIREGNSIHCEDYECDAWSHDSPIDEWKDCEHTTYNETNTSSNQNTYNNVCQIVMDHNKTRDNKGWFNEHKIMEDEDDEISDLKDYLIQKDPPNYVSKEKEKYKERRYKLLGIPYVKPPTCKLEKFEEVIEFGDSYKAPPKETAKDKGLAVECFNCHKMGYFAREFRSPRSQDKEKRESYKKDPKVEEPASKTMIAIDGIGWDWSYMAEEDEASKNHALVADEEEVPTEYVLMAKSSSSSDNEVYDVSFCSKSCRKNTENLNTKINKLNEELSDCETDLYNYKTGLSQVEARLVEFKENEIKFYAKIRVLERDKELKDNKIKYLRNELEEDSGFSRHMTSNISYLSEYKPLNGGYVSFGHGRGKITGKGSIKIDFMLVDDKHVLLRTPGQQNIYTIDFKNVVPHKFLTCLIAKALVDERKRHKASCKSKLVKSISKPLHTLHMALFGPTSNDVAERRNRTLIEAARTMLADAKLPVTFWAEAVNTACYIQNRVLVIKPHNKTPYELFNERFPAIGFLRPFGCYAMILNTLDHLGKFDAKGDEGYFVGYSLSSKAIRVFNKRTKKIKENLHVDFLENRSIEKGIGPDWLFDIDTLTNSMNYVPVVVTGTSSTNISAAKKDDAIPNNNAPQKEQEDVNGDKEVPESSGNSNPTTSIKVFNNDSFELASSSTLETEVPTVSTLVPIGSLYVPPVTSSVPRIISKGGSSYPEPLSLGNAMSFENRLEDFFRDTSDVVSLNDVEADLSNIETAIQEEGIDYEEVFTSVTRIEGIRLFLAYASYMGFTVYQIDVKSAFLYGTIDEEVFLDNGFQRDIRSAKTPMDTENPWGKDGTGKDVELHLYRSMIGTLMYLTASRPDIMFAICACARHQVTPKECHLYAVKRIFSDYGGANQDRKSTTRGCQFLGRRLISWQCKKQTFVATSITEAEYVAAASGCGQVLWIQNQLLDYGRHLKLNDEEGISTLPDNELFENLSLLGFNSLPNQSNIATALVCLATNRTYNFSKMIFDGMMRNDKNETAFPTGDVRYEEAFLTVTHLDAGQDRENIAKTSSMPHEASPRVTSLGGGEGKSRLLRIMRRGEKDLLKKMLQTYGGVDQGEDLLVGDTVKDSDKSADNGSDCTDEMANVLGTLGAANILDSGGLRSNEIVAKYLSEYEQAEVGLSHDEKVELIDELLMYQRNLAQIKNNAGWKVKDFKGMTFEQIKEKFIPIYEKLQDFVSMNSMLESERLKRPGIQLGKESFKKLKTVEASSTEPSQEQQSKEPKELSEEELKKMTELVPVEELYIEALQCLKKTGYAVLNEINMAYKGVFLRLDATYEETWIRHIEK
nr:uncharacterized mitochondrial protein AtMg00810-like [Tanacetum cinerariifolium]GEW72538.1 uncharacterized mitochondrial protein AtMg00810-like [Tanacetum cinerariifolium]